MMTPHRKETGLPGSVFFEQVPDLEAELVKLLAQVPAGRVTTFGRIGTALGERQAARWLAGSWTELCDKLHLPGHRVVLRDGSLPRFRHSRPVIQARLLRGEGVAVAGGKVSLNEVLWDQFFSRQPLERLREIQGEVARQVRLRTPRHWPRLVAGLDISYHGGRGVAAYVLAEGATGRMVRGFTLSRPVKFPYISGFLTFREAPLHLELLAAMRQKSCLAEVLLVDGTGILHPRRAGIAAHLGVLTGIPTVGVSKRLLCGQREDPLPGADRSGKARRKELQGAASHSFLSQNISLNGELAGCAVQRREGGGKLFVSPGHLTSVAWSAELVRRLWQQRKLPEPLAGADAESRRAAWEEEISDEIEEFFPR